MENKRVISIFMNLYEKMYITYRSTVKFMRYDLLNHIYDIHSYSSYLWINSNKIHENQK